MVEAVVRGGFIASFFMENNRDGDLSISHLLFSDDTLIFYNVDCNQIQALRAILLCFKAISGLKVNLKKSELVLVGEVRLLNLLIGLLGCEIVSLRMKYLELLWEQHSKQKAFGMM